MSGSSSNLTSGHTLSHNPQYNSAVETKEQRTLSSIEEYSKRGIKYRSLANIFLEAINNKLTLINIPNSEIDSLPDYLYLPNLLDLLYSHNYLTSIPDAMLRTAYIDARYNRLSSAEISRIIEFIEGLTGHMIYLHDDIGVYTCKNCGRTLDAAGCG